MRSLTKGLSAMTLILSCVARVTVLALLVSGTSLGAGADNSVLALCPQHQYADSRADVIGLVRDVESGELLYCEYHTFNENTAGSQVTKNTSVEYRGPDQVIIATKFVDYAPSLLRPNVVQKDLRHNELRSSLNNSLKARPTATDKGQKPAINVSYRKPNSDETKSVAIELEDMLVVDVGFDEAVKKYWYTLTRGEKLTISFLSPVHLRTIKLTVKQSKSDKCYKEPYDKETQVCFLINPSNMVLNLFVKPLALTYDLTSKHLVRFKGDVNITNPQGLTQNAMINYHYVN